MLKNPNTMILFDIDGTLTEPRQPIRSPMINALHKLCKYSEIGLVTGSGMDYIKEQLWPIFNSTAIKENCHLLPLNGTQYIIPAGEKHTEFHTITTNSMSDELGSEVLNKIFKFLCILQTEMIEKHEIPLSGHFISNRGSTINWCPIGRNADNEQRENFKQIDRVTGLRLEYLERFAFLMRSEDLEVTVKLGGDTSFDIYPDGWDKTYALSNFDRDSWNFWFIGDRCYPEGNDFELFELFKGEGRAFETSGPEETIEIIERYILEELK